MNTLLKFGLFALGLGGILIGGGIALFGSHPVVSFFNAALKLVHDGGPIDNFAEPNIDSELRFYGVMFAFYGAILIQTASDLTRYTSRVPVLLGVFALAGLARLIGYFSLGPPHALFIVLMSIEIILPAVLFFCWRGRRKISQS